MLFFLKKIIISSILPLVIFIIIIFFFFPGTPYYQEVFRAAGYSIRWRSSVWAAGSLNWAQHRQAQHSTGTPLRLERQHKVTQDRINIQIRAQNLCSAQYYIVNDIIGIHIGIRYTVYCMLCMLC